MPSNSCVNSNSTTSIAREKFCGHVFLAMREHTIMEDIFCAVHAGAI
jgi:hypothetical protein